MSRIRLAARALRLALNRAHADPTADYDAASSDYDTFFSPVMGGHSTAALDEVPIAPGDSVVELACGTGHLTAEIIRRLDGRGVVRAVDKSPGMLDVAKRKVHALTAGTPGVGVELSVGDMDSFIRGLPDRSADLVVVGWAICYTKPPKLLAEIVRVLRPGGRVMVIETRADAHQALTEGLEKVFADDPSLLTSLIRVALPKNAATVARWFGKAGLTVTGQRDGAQVIPAHTPAAVLEWVQRSGAAAGFKTAVDNEREQLVLDRVEAGLAELLEKKGALEIQHTFVVVTGAKPVTPRARHGARTGEEAGVA
ncbi:class I SAM-dependent methyltransferase [Streptomyces aureoverticillatus]|uniref:class I SAM-dependent methyltransferase n=1 Tax=Streptomyces aureoverticillatus TaxID=66871 RepID=UPI0013DA6FDB|nr:class I SAM-dependent methyltransferase [Streptomyces aureoverticillatus]QIB43466.1 methyltransferase domain-containing protein [Streptomyces aureoverticillatus]